MKAPTPGRVKTRLLRCLSPEEASQLYQRLVRDTLRVATRLSGIHVVVAYAADAQYPTLRWISRPYATIPQRGRDLGERLSRAFAWAFAHGARRVVVMGSDAPDLSARWIRQAFRALAAHDVVVGPTLDGGYHLIGLNEPRPAYFRHIPWSTARVCSTTLARIARRGDRVFCLTPIFDLDIPRDLKRYARQLHADPARLRRSLTARYLLRLGCVRRT